MLNEWFLLNDDNAIHFVRKMKKLLNSFLLLAYLFVFTGCSESPDKKDKPTLQGTVYNAQTLQVIGNKAIYIFLNDESISNPITDRDGMYRIEDLDYSGRHDILCSALNYKDTTISVTFDEGKVSTGDFYLTPDNSIGTLRGELQYDSLFALDPFLASLSDQEIHDGVTGATLQSKWIDPGVTYPPIIMMGEDTLWPPVDTYGRFRIYLQAGTYSLTAVSEGFYPATKTKRVYADSTVYISFSLKKQ